MTGEPGASCFEDLCRGPHVPSTGRIGAFKVMQVAGAYWHGDATKQMLQRVYGTTFPDKKALNAHLQQLEEAKKRDHRKLGQELGLFTVDPLVGTGLVLWKPRGAIVRHILEGFILDELLRRGYQPVYTPHIGRLELYRTSGHFPYYKDSQYPPLFESERARRLNELWELARTGERTTRPTPGGAGAVQPHGRTSTRSCAGGLSRERADGRAAQAHPHLAGAGRRLPAQADELPAPHPHLRVGAAQLPRSAGPHRRVRPGLPLRAVGRGVAA